MYKNLQDLSHMLLYRQCVTFKITISFIFVNILQMYLHMFFVFSIALLKYLITHWLTKLLLLLHTTITLLVLYYYYNFLRTSDYSSHCVYSYKCNFNLKLHLRL